MKQQVCCLTTLRANNLLSTSFQGIGTLPLVQPLKKSYKKKIVERKIKITDGY